MAILKISAVLLMVCLYHTQANYCAFGQQKVCGADYITYPNICAIQVAGVQLVSYGPCTQMKTGDGKLISNCPKTYVPVCGLDGITYGNECRLKNANVDKAFEGPCNTNNYVAATVPRTCDCASDFSAVCSLGGVTFENQCVLNCSQQIAQNLGPCVSQCNCERKYDPVCGIDGRTYDNACTLNCVRATKYGQGECPALTQSCSNCSLVPTPVCGEDNKNYLNLCNLKCKGIKLQAFGLCKKTVSPANTCSQCSNLKNPVCGTDGKNYANECLATCNGITKKYCDGECPNADAYKNQHCVGVISKCCGKDGVTYDNFCFLQSAKTDLHYHGECISNKTEDVKPKHNNNQIEFATIGVIAAVPVQSNSNIKTNNGTKKASTNYKKQDHEVYTD